MRRTRVVGGLVVVVAAGIAAYGMRPRAAPRVALVSRVETREVHPGTLDVPLRVSGVLQAANSSPIVNTSRQSQIVWMLPDGSPVKEGEVVMRVDDTALSKEVTDAETQNADSEDSEKTNADNAQKRVENAKSGLAKAKDDLRLARLQTKAALEKGAADVEFQQKELDIAQTDYDKYSRLGRAGMITRLQLEAQEDNLAQARFNKAKSERALAQAKKDGEAAEQVKQYDIAKAELELEMAESALNQTQRDAARAQLQRTQRLVDAQSQLADAEIKAPASGMLLVEQMWDDGMRPMRVGDQVHEQQRVAAVVDPNQMQVRCDISERDVENVRAGEKARVRVPALGDRLLSGTVKAVDSLAREQAWWEGGVPGKKAFAAVIALADRDARLRPGMSATVEIILKQVQAPAMVPVECLFGREGKTIAYRLDGDHFQEVPVTVGARNEMEAAVKSGLRAGDKVASELPSAEMMAESEARKR